MKSYFKNSFKIEDLGLVILFGPESLIRQVTFWFIEGNIQYQFYSQHELNAKFRKGEVFDTDPIWKTCLENKLLDYRVLTLLMYYTHTESIGSFLKPVSLISR